MKSIIGLKATVWHMTANQIILMESSHMHTWTGLYTKQFASGIEEGLGLKEFGREVKRY